MDKLIFLLVAVLVLSSCKKPLQNSTITQDDRDSSYVQSIRMVPIGIKADAVNLTAQILCDPLTGKPKPFSLNKRGKRSSLSANLSPSGSLFVASNCDSLTELIAVKDTEVRVLKKQLQEKVKVEPVRSVAWYDILARWVTLFFVLFLAYKFTQLIQFIQNKYFP